jgi:hypothetical protein
MGKLEFWVLFPMMLQTRILSQKDSAACNCLTNIYFLLHTLACVV